LGAEVFSYIHLGFHAPMTFKLLLVLLRFLPILIFVWRRATMGWRGDFLGASSDEGQMVRHNDAQANFSEISTKIGWVTEAMVQYKLRGHWLFDLSPQSAIHFSRELEVGSPLLDEKFFIAPESWRFVTELTDRSDLRQHLLLLQTRLARHGAKLMRLGSEGNSLAIRVNVRWTDDRPALYRDVLVWMVALDDLLHAETPTTKTQATKTARSTSSG
jgi:hypothetical protein